MTDDAELHLTGLTGTDPLGFLAALGALDVTTRAGRPARLRWTDTLVPHAVLSGAGGLDEVVALVVADLATWRSSPLLTWGPEGKPLVCAKPLPEQLRAWVAAVLPDPGGDRTSVDLLSALLAEGGRLSHKGQCKPTDFYFMTGNQKFLDMVRKLREGLLADPALLRGSLKGPWIQHPRLPVLRWETGMQRMHALSGEAPAELSPKGDPGANWLAFMGLTFFPVAIRRPRLRTSGMTGSPLCFRWPLWGLSASSPVVRSLVADATVFALSHAEQASRGIIRLLQAPVQRVGKGEGYGSFGGATEVVSLG